MHLQTLKVTTNLEQLTVGYTDLFFNNPNGYANLHWGKKTCTRTYATEQCFLNLN